MSGCGAAAAATERAAHRLAAWVRWHSGWRGGAATEDFPTISNVQKSEFEKLTPLLHPRFYKRGIKPFPAEHRVMILSWKS